MSDRRARLERRYRRLLAWYPRAHRERHGEEMLSVLLAGAGEKRWPGIRESVDLLCGAARVHWRHSRTDDDQAWVDALAIVSVLAPMLLLVGTSYGMLELGWIIAGDGRWTEWTSMPWWTFPSAPVWLIWFVVALLGMRGARRTAAAGAWLATIGLVVVTMLRPGGYWWPGMAAAWIPLGLLAAVSLTSSPGPARGRDLMGRRLPVMVAATVIFTWAVGTLGYHLPGAPLVLLAVQIIGVVAVCRPGTRPGRRAALMLIVLLMTTWLASITQFSAPIPVIVAVFYGAAPLGVLLVLGLSLRRLKQRAD